MIQAETPAHDDVYPVRGYLAELNSNMGLGLETSELGTFLRPLPSRRTRRFDLWLAFVRFRIWSAMSGDGQVLTADVARTHRCNHRLFSYQFEHGGDFYFKPSHIRNTDK